MKNNRAIILIVCGPVGGGDIQSALNARMTNNKEKANYITPVIAT